MEIKLSDIGPCKKNIKVSISVEDIQKKYDEFFQEVSKDAVVPGFRPGKTPKAVLEKKFGKMIFQDVQNSLLANTWQEILDKHKVEPITEPEIVPKNIQMEVGKQCNFEINFETKPQFGLDKYKGIEVKKTTTEVTEQELDMSLKEFQKMKGELVPLETGKSQADDILICNVTLNCGEAVVWQKENVSVPVADTKLMGILIEKKFVLDRSKDDLCKQNIKFPEDFREKEHAGKDGSLLLKVCEIKRIQLPELNDALAKEMGAENITDLRNKIKDHLQRQKSSESDHKVEDEILKNIVDKLSIPLPEQYYKERLQRSQEAARHDLKMMKQSEKDINEYLEKEKATIEETVARSIKEQLVLDKVADLESIKATEEEVNEHIRHLAYQERKWPNEIRALLEKKGLMPEIEAEVRQQKARRFLREQAKIIS